MRHSWSVRVATSYLFLVFGASGIGSHAATATTSGQDADDEPILVLTEEEAPRLFMSNDGGSNDEAKASLFSSEWEQEFFGGAGGGGLVEPGCNKGRGSFWWRKHGFGSNINS